MARDQSPVSRRGDRKSGAPVETDDDALLRTMRKRWSRSMEAEKPNRDLHLESLKFLIGENHWDKKAEQAREEQGRPHEVFNLLPKFFFQVANELRQNSPGYSVKPETEDADKEAAQVVEGMLRHINNRSNGDYARKAAYDQQVGGGWGYYGVTTAYTHDDPEVDEPEERDEKDERELWEQEIRIRHIPNALACHDDPDAKLPDRSDRRFFFIEDTLQREDFEARYPKAVGDYQTTASDAGEEFAGWWDKDTRRLVEYWYITETYRDVKGKAVPPDMDASNGGGNGKPSPVRTRRIAKRTCQWAICTGREVLERGEFPIDVIPMVFVPGWIVNLNGKQHLEGMVAQSFGPQRAYNYLRTAQMERIGLHALAPWMMAEGQDRGHEAMWQSANSVAHAALKYVPVAIGEKLVPPPQRMDGAPPPGDILAANEAAKQDLFEAFGMSRPSVGQSSGNPTLGQDRIEMLESDTANYHFVDGVKLAILAEARIIKKLIPKIYDTERVQRIVGEDGTADMARLNTGRPEGVERKAMWQTYDVDGKPVKHFDLGVGEYDVVVGMGPSFSTQAQQAANGMLELMKINPGIAMILLPFFAKLANWKEHETIGELTKALWPPQVQAAEAKLGKVPPEQENAQLRAQVQQAGAMLQQMQGVIQKLQAEVTDKRSERALKLILAATQAEIEKFKSIAQVSATRMQAESKMFAETVKHAHGLAADVAGHHLDTVAEGARAALAQPSAAEQAAGGGAGGAGGAPQAQGAVGAPPQGPEPGTGG